MGAPLQSGFPTHAQRVHRRAPPPGWYAVVPEFVRDIASRLQSFRPSFGGDGSPMMMRRRGAAVFPLLPPVARPLFSSPTPTG